MISQRENLHKFGVVIRNYHHAHALVRCCHKAGNYIYGDASESNPEQLLAQCCFTDANTSLSQTTSGTFSQPIDDVFRHAGQQ